MSNVTAKATDNNSASEPRRSRLAIRTNVRAGEMGAVSQAFQRSMTIIWSPSAYGSDWANSLYGKST